jgi:hypothetical protein
MRPRPFALTILALLSAFGAQTATAQSITLSPAVVPLAGSFGQSVTSALTLRNDSDLALEFVMEAQDVVVRDGERVFIEAGALADSVAASAVFVPRQVRVEARSSASVTVTMTLPPTLRHRAAVAFFRGTTPVASGDRSAFLSLGTLFTFAVSDRLSVAAGELTARPPTASANARLETTLLNDGDEPVVPSGVAAILDAEGRLLGKAPFAARRLLPGERSTAIADYPGDLRAGVYRTIATFDVAGRDLTLTGSLEVP